MIRIFGIYTIRDTPQPHYWDIVFDWEDQLAASLGVPLVPVGTRYDKIYKPGILRKILNRINAFQCWDKFFFRPTHYYVAFHIGPPGVYSFYTRSDVIPIIIDFWKSEDLIRFQRIFSLSQKVFITSLEVYHYLQQYDIKLTLDHLSLSLPDKFFVSSSTVNRDIDVIQMGRSNSLLQGYMNQFIAHHPQTHYVFAQRKDNRVVMVSNKQGVLGSFDDRAAFMELLYRSRVSLVSAPGLDEDKKRTGGFSPVTPRFLESAACGCKLLGVYPDNDDFLYYGINEVCTSVHSYDEFEHQLLKLLSDNEPINYSSFLKRHLTSKRAEELIQKLS